LPALREKPVALVADAILDCSKRGGVVLDCFGGSGTTLIAAEKTHRHAHLIELDPNYVDRNHPSLSEGLRSRGRPRREWPDFL
jgi:DNA modification methylase